MFVSKRDLLILAGLAAAVAMPAQAAEKKADPNKEQVRRLQQAQRKLEQEKTLLAQEKAAVESELEEARRKADAEARRAAGFGRELAGLRKTKDDLAGKLAETEAELRKTQEAQKTAEGEGQRLQAALAGEKQQHAACVNRNQELHKVGSEVLERYRAKSCSDSLLQAEPFTGLKRIQIENAVEDLQERLDSQKLGS